MVSTPSSLPDAWHRTGYTRAFVKGSAACRNGSAQSG
ncbi:hypothetical protein predicted by Glimmer/Critica [Acetobacter senegalensis]|uniref:Uncharacterized protein n=1 Tax=Acetobacter senegalensis TaxID=446692 RepID=A0A0U5ERL0_9PROT|nr:hypothetical protein predicted by Glimmer/Critica [Acetobacter senegalensis]